MIILESSNFLTSGIISWAVPIGLVLSVGAWWGVVLTRRAFAAARDER